ncbi:hypothetical protein HRbin36_00501 [bacterium HR36]|nr:hypothetical protein HRbin36_00501 [bacterium HR36]
MLVTTPGKHFLLAVPLTDSEQRNGLAFAHGCSQEGRQLTAGDPIGATTSGRLLHRRRFANSHCSGPVITSGRTRPLATNHLGAAYKHSVPVSVAHACLRQTAAQV